MSLRPLRENLYKPIPFSGPDEFEVEEEDEEEEDRGLEVGRRRKLHAVYDVHEEIGR